ncbi:hypothetical protein NDU88_002332 [Pleurodeles waltl]|uniref:Uncharacterized protein n=1 Tax=Pleurodeles waltl TaxID=8319 RepID=A0AAV7T1M8_PLEWA|nr:hypothetical protein NDU88_002332 [Pleurodeles waltl]
MDVGVVTASIGCVLIGVLVMVVMDEDVVHAGVSVDATGREVEYEEEGDTVEAVDVGVSLGYSPKKVCQIIVACCMLPNLPLRHQVPFLQEEEAGDGCVAAVDPVNSEDEEGEDEDEDNRSALIHQYFQ